MLTFSRSHVADKLRELPVLSCGGFAAAAATRTVPSYVEYCIETRTEDSGQVSAALSYVWNFLEGTVSDLQAVRHYYNLAYAQTRVLAIPGAEWPPWVQDAAVAVVYCLEFLLDRDVEDAINAASNSFDAAWQYTVFLAVRSKPRDSRYHVDRWLSNPIVQLELSRQERDLSMLKNSDPQQLAATIKALRDLAERERVVPIGNS